MQERKVTVKNKNGQTIAVFRNDYAVSDRNAQKNVMVSPTIDIVSNGSSTLTFQMLIESEKWQQIKHPENLYYCKNRVYTALNEGSIEYDNLVVNVTLVELWYLLAYTYVQAHNTNTEIEPIDTHTVKILPKTDPKYKLTVNGVTYEDSQVTDSRGIVMPRGSAGYALWAILKGTDWTLGVCDVLPDGFSAANDYGVFNVESDMKSALENIQLIQELYGGILDWDSEHKILNLRDEGKESDFNTWKGFVARQEKNLIDYPKVTWDNNLITRLYPLGNGNLNIAKVNNNKNYIDNFSYTAAVYEGYLQNANIYDTNDDGGQKTLKFWGERQLEKLCRPRKKIDYTIVDKRGTPEGWAEPFDINHIVKAYYNDTETGEEVFEYLRIIHVTENWFWPGSDTVIEVGDKISDDYELIYQTYKTVQNAAPTDSSGNISAEDIVVELPFEYLYELYGDDWATVYGYGGGYGSLALLTNIHAEHETENTQAIADLSAYADATFATIESFTTFEHWTENEFSQSWTKINQTSSALEAQITLEANHYNETKEAISNANAQIQLTANDLEAKITSTANYAKEYADGRFTEANAIITQVSNSLSAEVNAKASYDYVNQKTGEVSSSLAEFRAYADQNYASASLTAKINNTVASLDLTVKSLQNGNGEISVAKLTADNVTIRASAYGVVAVSSIDCSLLVCSSTFTYKGHPVSVKTVKTDAGTYHLLGIY